MTKGRCLEVAIFSNLRSHFWKFRGDCSWRISEDSHRGRRGIQIQMYFTARVVRRTLSKVRVKMGPTGHVACKVPCKHLGVPVTAGELSCKCPVRSDSLALL